MLRSLKIWVLFLSFIFSIKSYSQTSYTLKTNWWQPIGAQTNRTLFKIPIVETGMYKLTYTELLNAGFPVSSADPKTFQMFFRGEEQAIIINGEQDGIFDAQDEILFYAQRNDGFFDSELYFPSNHQVNRDVSMYSDTAYYWLSWQDDGSFGKRMTETNGSTVTGNFVPYINKTARVNYYGSYEPGDENGSGHPYQAYNDKGEGWVSSGNNIHTTSFENISVTNNGTNSKLTICFIGRTGQTNVSISIKPNDVSTYNVVHPNISYTGKGKFTYSFNIPNNQITSSNNKIDLKIELKGGPPFKMSYIKIEYQSAKEVFSNQEIFSLDSSSVGTTSEINLTGNWLSPIIYDISEPNNCKKIIGSISGNSLQAIINQGSYTSKLITNNNQFLTVSDTIIKTIFYPIDTNVNYMILSHPKLWNEATQYNDYRSSIQGGGYNAKLYSIYNLYDIFTYGEQTPVAIKRFCDYMLSHANPEYFLIIGIGANPFMVQERREVPYNNTDRAGILGKYQSLIPTCGFPGSDMVFSIQMHGATWKHIIPTGRISALYPHEVSNYLNKVIEYESVSDTAFWRKNILHLSGGKTDSEIVSFKGIVDGFKSIAVDEYFGAQVFTISKTVSTSTPITHINVSDYVNNGLSLITFFGHSSTQISDIDIGYVSDPINNYQNKGKYPIILLNGCTSGNVYSGTYTFGEDWVNAANAGAIAFIAHSDVGASGALSTYSNQYYFKAFNDSSFYGTSIGNIMKGVVEALPISNKYYKAMIHEMTLLGDPAIKPHSPLKPDLEITNQSIFIKSTDNNPVTAVSDSIIVGISIKNKGKYNAVDSFYVSVSREVNGNIVSYSPKKYGSVKNIDTIFYVIELKNIDAYGLNKFKVHVDYNSDIGNYNGYIDELYENNNEGTLNYLMPLSSVTPLFPAEFSIVSDNSNMNPYNVNKLDLTIQSTDLLTQQKEYYFEIDTSAQFTNPISTKIVSGGVLATWENVPIVPFLVQLPGIADSVVFYWRARYNELTPGEDTLWGVSSFIYIYSNPYGWSQTHEYQFKRDNFEDVSIFKNVWKFDSIIANVKLLTVGNQKPYLYNYHGIFVNNVRRDWTGPSRGFRVLVIDGDKFTLKHINGFSFDYNQTLGYGLGEFYDYPNDYNYIFNFGVTSSIQGFKNFIDSVETGDYILLTSMDRAFYSTWIANGFDSTWLSQLGAQHFPPPDSVGYVGIFKKDYPTKAIDKAGLNSLDIVSIDTTISTKSNVGNVISTIIGPSTEWGKYYRQVKKEPADDYNVSFYGLDLNNSQTFIFNAQKQNDVDLSSLIDANQYPFIKLVAELSDVTNRTAPQLKGWQVTAKNEIAEGIIITENHDYSFKQKYEGEKNSYDFTFKNISSFDFKNELIVEYKTIGLKNTILLGYDTLKALKSGESQDFSFTFSTEGIEGVNNLQVFVNPRIQPEQYYANNVFQVSYEVLSDKVNPLLDVTFDGVRIMDGDIVSPSPEIVIRMNDDNKNLFKKDTTNIDIFIKQPGSSIYQRVHLYQSNIDVVYADKSNDFTIYYRPENLVDGTYWLSVQVADALGNRSGVEPYTISFEVINESSITYFYPYPNPFSTNMKFAYTFTGLTQPEDFKIQIMTISGKIVREINQSEIGILKVGKHLTDFSWDGTDEFGDRLANGVYLYRVISKIDGEKIKHRETSADEKSFTKNWGKIYILR